MSDCRKGTLADKGLWKIMAGFPDLHFDNSRRNSSIANFREISLENTLQTPLPCNNNKK